MTTTSFKHEANSRQFMSLNEVGHGEQNLIKREQFAISLRKQKKKELIRAKRQKLMEQVDHGSVVGGGDKNQTVNGQKEKAMGNDYGSIV